MEGQGGDTNASQRWTCEACGCNTNHQSDRSCTICGTATNSGRVPNLLRRHAVGANLSARASWFARGLTVGRGISEEMGLDEDELWDSVVDGVEVAGEDPDAGPLESMAMDLSGAARARLESSRRRFLEAARAFSQANRDANSAVNQAELLRVAVANAPSYQPRWANPSQLGGSRARVGNGIEVPEGERQNVAHVPIGSGEGRAIRAENPLPRFETAVGSFNLPVPSVQELMRRRVFGFRVAFDHPTCEVGGSMGGYYLVGVTTASFSSFSDENGLQDSPCFWGIEDSCQKYEGPRYSHSREGQRPSFGTELAPEEAPRNPANVLFGSREVVTVVCDFDSRTLTFWRDETLLGTLVSNIPRSGHLYPVAVPYNVGVTVAITGLNNDPLPLLRSFATDWKVVQKEKEESLRKKLVEQRSVLIQNGAPSSQLIAVLQNIFALYTTDDSDVLDETQASRLWYRSGLRLSCLKVLMTDGRESSAGVSFADFRNIISKIIEEDDNFQRSILSVDDRSATVEVGDKVELADGYEKYSDAPGGPLQPGDRGTVVELQRAPNGTRRSVRVLHNGRRWWYQPQAVVAERSGLIESPGVWFLRGLLRSHGYDHVTLGCLQGCSSEVSPFHLGDAVVPVRGNADEVNNNAPPCAAALVGYVAADSTVPVPSTASHPEFVSVECVSRWFVDGGATAETSLGMESKRVRASKLVHAALQTALLQVEHVDPNIQLLSKRDAGLLGVSDTPDDFQHALSGTLTEKLRSEIAGVAQLDRHAMTTVIKELRKSCDTLATFFSSGLPEAVTAALDLAERMMNSLEPREDLPEKLATLGALATTIAEQLFTSSAGRTPILDDMDIESVGSESGKQQMPRLVARNQTANGRLQDLRVRRESNREPNGALDSTMSAVQQRRSMLFTLMSRAGRRDSSPLLNEMLEHAQPREINVGYVSQSNSRGVPPFVFGPPAEFLDDGWDDSVPLDSRLQLQGDTGQYTVPLEPASIGSTPFDSFLRCRGSESTGRTSSSSRQGGTILFSFVRNLIYRGFLLDSVEWVKGIIEAQCKNSQLSQPQKSSASFIRNLADEEGTPLLLLAVSLGCSRNVLQELITFGGTVGQEELKKAAYSDQPDALSLLLKYSSYSEGLVDLNKCSGKVKSVLTAARERQESLAQKMRDAAGTFMELLIRKLVRLGLSARKNQCNRLRLCSKAIFDVLVGNVLLQALQRAQKSMAKATQVARPEHDGPDASDLSGRFAVEDNAACAHVTSAGLLGFLPDPVAESIFSLDNQNITFFLLLIEDCLCSKDLGDSAAGLTILSLLLKKLPQLKSSGQLARFGLIEMISFHDVLATNRIAEILANQFRSGLDVSVRSSSGAEVHGIDSALAATRQVESGVVLCPKKHTAVLHITRHASFRCDLCGKGVERGRPMHGCRECDWDACEDCTDKAESGLVKCSAIRELASSCVRLLSEGTSDAAIGGVNDDFSRENNTTQLHALSVRLLRRDIQAAKEVGTLLNDHGAITIHQFLTIILPALHASMVGRSSSGDGSLISIAPGRVNKKPRVVDECLEGTVDCPDARFEFCRKAAPYLLIESASIHDEAYAGNEGAKGEGNDSSVRTVLRVDAETGHNDAQNVETSKETSSIQGYVASTSELLRRLHQILSLYESVGVLSSACGNGQKPSASKTADLYSLTSPIKLHLCPLLAGDKDPGCRSCILTVDAEPLLPIADLQLHILRCHKSTDPSYLAFCRSLAMDKAVIIERPVKGQNGQWKLGQVVEFDESLGAHAISYATGLIGMVQTYVQFDSEGDSFLERLVYSQSRTFVVLSARNYYILKRYSTNALLNSLSVPCVEMDQDTNQLTAFDDAVGTRVELITSPAEGLGSCTMVRIERSSESESDVSICVVGDDGTVHRGIRPSQIKFNTRISPDEVQREDRGAMRSFPFFPYGQRTSSRGNSEGGPPTAEAIVLRRSWSALSLVDSMRPVELSLSNQEIKRLPSIGEISWPVKLNDANVIVAACSAECPPRLQVLYSAHEKLPAVNLSSSDATLIGALKELNHHQSKWCAWPPSKSCQLFFSVVMDSDTSAKQEFGGRETAHALPTSEAQYSGLSSHAAIDDGQRRGSWLDQLHNRARKLSSRSLSTDDDDSTLILCDGLDEICIQCMETISLLAEHVEDFVSPRHSLGGRDAGFANTTLSKKLMDQLDDPLCVVGNAMPRWCVAAPSFAPKVFTYDSRRALLERAAFGVSRGTLKQQEAKVNVGRLRQRMASLRARAVELVGEAFSGGAEDPTALQLQADELYGMEENLAARVRASFRAVRWQEHSLQVAKVAVRREKLLSDAAAVMDRYANDDLVCRRRLEVRFDGESGFDAASGDEAGVTRGFYADVAEALLACDNVEGVFCSTNCNAQGFSKGTGDLDELEKESSKLPLWIPDMDSSGQVVIPTPRADERSGLGVYPRPLPSYHPRLANVLQRFRFMGRLFASAMRDGFMFPLPLAASFLRLVQYGSPSKAEADYVRTPLQPQNSCAVLTSIDLPRPGFLGGEVYAAHAYICRALDRLDAADPPLSRSELERRYIEIARDKGFAQVALGKNYECSFEDYFQDRTFVDPLDPAQDEEAAPLCPEGHRKSVTVYNVREWVALSKAFILYDGVIAQAVAFRSGIEDFFCSNYLRLFTSEELQRDVCGVGDDVDKWDESSVRKLFKLDGGKGAAEALVAVAAIGGEGGAALSRRFGPASPTISFLVKALLEASPKQRRQFLSFVTSVPIVTPGKIEVVPIVSPSGEFLPMRDPACLPRANTCARRLYLPKFETFETFAQVLWAVVHEESTFKGFYEWRGS